MCPDAAGCHGDWSDGLHKYSAREPATPKAHSVAQLISGVFCSPLSFVTAAASGVAGSGARRRHRQGQANFPRQLNPACAHSSCQPPSCKVTRPIFSSPPR